MKKRMISLVLALAMCLSLCTTVFAEDATHEITEENYAQVGQFTFDDPIIRCIQPGEIVKPGTEEDTVNGGQFGGVTYRKNITSYSDEWSGWTRVSDNMSGSLAGGTLSTNRSQKYSATFTGAVGGLSFSGSKELSSEVGYSFNVPAGVTAYIAHRCCFRLESGYRESISDMTGKVTKRAPYTAKVPQYGEYALITVN